MDKIRIGVIGLGGRGHGLLSEAILPQEFGEVTAVCDLYADRAEKEADFCVEKGFTRPKTFTDYKELLASGLVDVVINSTSWQSHVPVALDAMRAHIAVGTEVGGACSLEDCFALIRTQKETGTPFGFLENCCYDKNETTLLRMIEAGIFGKIVAVDGGYMHDLRNEVAFGKENRHYRLEHYKTRNCENYPTHELGPLARMLDIGKSNRMVSLVSVASGSFGLHEYIARDKKNDEELLNTHFNQGDVITTVITCAQGQTITLRLDTTLPRPYCRGITVHGTKAFYEEDNNLIFIDGEHNANEFNARAMWGNFDAYVEKYRDANWEAVANGLTVGGHGGMDYFMMRDFLSAVKDGRPVPIDVYDGAEWMAVTPLSAQSIAENGKPVEFPDFRSF